MNKIGKKLITIVSATLLTASMFIGCSSNAQTVEENKTLRVGVMSAADAAPILLAKEKGYFEEAGVDLQLEIFTNGATKQSSIQAGELDGAMVSIIQFLNNKQAGLDARITTTTDGVFPVVLQKDFVEQKDVKVGLMEISVVNYLADQYLKDYNVEKVYINEMPVRLQMLLEGKLNMAVLPEPLASNAQLKGLEKRVYGEPEDFTPNAMIFTEEIMKNSPNTVKGFHDAYNKAVNDINNNPEEAKDVLIKDLELNEAVKDLIVLPKYHETRIPPKEYIEDIEVWTENIQGNELKLNYDDLVTKEYVK